MGQTLTHGVYLPDEGERNCYSGLAANWQILDNSVGTIAEHTTALSGKAPLVHTHTKSDITDFPVYGTTAGTICEGNDSRLSDARTPVAHTHTKSDVTDLLNSNFIPSANNSYDLGSSSYQWNNLYAKNYYYNGVAWGLDKANVWTGINLFTDNININKSRLSGIRLYNNDVDVTANSGQPDMTVSDSQSFISFKTKYQQNSAILDFTVLPTSAYTKLRFATRYHTNSSSFNSVVIDSTVDSSNNKSFAPASNNDVNLGTSTNKWKSFNSINPGALSLPTGNNSDSIAVDITNWYIQDPDYPDDPTKKILDATNHKVDTAVPGWLHINFPNVAGNWAYVRKYAAGTNMDFQRIADGNASSDFANVSLIFPIYLSCYVRIKAKTATVRIFPCLGNV